VTSDEEARQVVNPNAERAAAGFPSLPGPLDLVNRHPDIAVNVPLRNTAIRVYDAVPVVWPDDTYTWTPLRNRLAPRCYSLPSGSMVHVKPDCRC
jgi:hypothetical protein